MPGMVLERPIYLRERADGLYRSVTYLLYKSSEELAVSWLASIPYCLLLYFLVRLQGSFLLLWLVYAVSLGIATSECCRRRAHAPPARMAGGGPGLLLLAAANQPAVLH